MLLGVDFWPRKSCWCPGGGGEGAAGSRVLSAASGWTVDPSLLGSGLQLDASLLSWDAGDGGSGETKTTPWGGGVFLFLPCHDPEREENFASSADAGIAGLG